MRRMWARVAVSAVLLGPVYPAHAQDAAKIVEQLNRDAMDAYNGLEIDRAGGMLEEALRVCKEGGVGGSLLARTNLHLGVVYVGGLNDNDSGLNYFIAAVCADGSIEPDPLMSTPDIQSVFQVARQQAQAGACAGIATPSGAAVQTSLAPPPPDQVFVHQPPVEQLTQTPLPLYVEVDLTARPKKIVLFYKGLGMDEFRSAPMYRFQDGFAYQLSCNDVWEPRVSYYLEAHDEDGKVVGVFASREQPVVVPVVGARSQPEPALPGMQSPAQCKTTECPPGVKGCKQVGTAGIGEECTADIDCQSGLSCRDDACVLSGAGTTEVPRSLTDYDEPTELGEFRRGFVQVGLAMGFPFLKSGLPADRPAPQGLIFVTRTGTPIADPDTFAATQPDQLVFPGPDMAPGRQTAWVPDADSEDSAGPLGGNCSADNIPSGPRIVDQQGVPLTLPTKYCVRLKSQGFRAPYAALRLALGYFLYERLSLALIGRFQFAHGRGPLAAFLIGARAEYMLSEPVTVGGPMFSAYIGGTAGQIQAQGPTDQDDPRAPWAKTGLGGAHVGGNMRYRLHPNFGIYMSLEADFQLPTFMFNADVTLLGIEVAL